MKRTQFLMLPALMLCAMNCTAMDVNAPNVQVDHSDVLSLSTKDESSAKKALDAIITEGTTASFKDLIALREEEVDFHDLELLLMTIDARKRALSLVRQSRGMTEYHMVQIKQAIKELSAKTPFKAGSMPAFDRYIKQEETKLTEIEKIIESYKGHYSQEWHTNGHKMGYTVTKLQKMDESKN